MHPIKQDGKLRLKGKVAWLRARSDAARTAAEDSRLQNQASLPQHLLSHRHKPIYFLELQVALLGEGSSVFWNQLF